jgi:hypothetical protein
MEHDKTAPTPTHLQGQRSVQTVTQPGTQIGAPAETRTPPSDIITLDTMPIDAIPIDSMRVEVQARRWTMRVIALLLAGQAAILVAIIWLTVSRLNWELQFRYVMRSMTVMDTLLLGGLLLPMAVVDFLTAMGMWWGQRSSWLRAMMTQGILLIFCLSSYVSNRGHNYIFLLMLTCIVLVLYLNTYDVRLTFISREAKNRTHPR